jgi:hypothetical protein
LTATVPAVSANPLVVAQPSTRAPVVAAATSAATVDVDELREGYATTIRIGVAIVAGLLLLLAIVLLWLLWSARRSRTLAAADRSGFGLLPGGPAIVGSPSSTTAPGGSDRAG